MRGLIVGRFQPLHNGHASLIRAAIEDCVHVVVVVGSADAKPSVRNPFTADERVAMIRAAFPNVEVVAVNDLHDPPNWPKHVVGVVGPVDKVYGNDDRELDLWEDAGYAVVRSGLVERTLLEGTTVRAHIAEGDALWRKSVPKPVVELLDHWDAAKRLRLLEAKA